MKKFILNFLPFGLVITCLSLLFFFALHHEIRSAANNPQIEVAEDAVGLIQSGVAPITLFNSRLINIESRLKTFQIVYNDDGRVVGSNAFIEGEIPELSAEVLDKARSIGENRITWEPKEGVRIAAVIKRFEGKTATSSGFVLAGRSLKEVEKRQRNLLLEIMIGWAITMTVTGIALNIKNKKNNYT